MAPLWTAEDAWVLGALGGTSASSTASLSQVIAHCDALEHQVIEEHELVGSAGRLIAAALVQTDGAVYWHTDAGRELYLACGHQRASLLKGLRKLGDPPRAEPLVLSAGEFDQAAAEYSKQAQRLIDGIVE